MQFPLLEFIILLLLPTPPLRNPSPSVETFKEALLECLKYYDVPYIAKGQPRWTNLTTPFNLRLAYQPAVVIVPETEDQVGYSVICAGKTSYKVQAKGGGHSYASYSTGGKNGSVIIDLQNFDQIVVDQGSYYNWAFIMKELTPT
jgi:hypothetical protein